MKTFLAALVLIGTILAAAAIQASDKDCSRYDMNDDNKITATDALIVLRVSVGLDCDCN